MVNSFSISKRVSHKKNIPKHFSLILVSLAENISNDKKYNTTLENGSGWFTNPIPIRHDRIPPRISILEMGGENLK